VAVSVVAFALVWLGMILAAMRAANVLGRPAHPADPPSALDHVAVVALLTFLAQSVIDGIQNVYGQPHYFNGTLIAYIFFAWLAADVLAARRSTAWLPWAYAAAMPVVLVAVICRAERGTRSIEFGPPLGDQIAVVQTINSSGPGSTVTVDEGIFLFHFISLRTLGDLIPKSPAGPPRNLRVRFRSDDPDDARIEIIDRDR
jgi:hypothetical protein